MAKPLHEMVLSVKDFYYAFTRFLFFVYYLGVAYFCCHWVVQGWRRKISLPPMFRFGPFMQNCKLD